MRVFHPGPPDPGSFEMDGRCFCRIVAPGFTRSERAVLVALMAPPDAPGTFAARIAAARFDLGDAGRALAGLARRGIVRCDAAGGSLPRIVEDVTSWTPRDDRQARAWAVADRLTGRLEVAS